MLNNINSGRAINACYIVASVIITDVHFSPSQMYTCRYSQKDHVSSSGAVGGPPSDSSPQPQAQFGKQFNKSSSGGTATHLHKDLNTYAKKPPVKALSEG